MTAICSMTRGRVKPCQQNRRQQVKISTCTNDRWKDRDEGVMSMKVEMTIDEAKEVLDHVLRVQGLTGFAELEAKDSVVAGSAVSGAINIVRGLQEMGWRIARPLKEV